MPTMFRQANRDGCGLWCAYPGDDFSGIQRYRLMRDLKAETTELEHVVEVRETDLARHVTRRGGDLIWATHGEPRLIDQRLQVELQGPLMAAPSGVGRGPSCRGAQSAEKPAKGAGRELAGLLALSQTTV
jgi:hypothetical protein